MDQFWKKVAKTESCWLWTAYKNDKGYGQYYRGNRMQYAHRIAYELLVGPIPPGFQLDHLCRVRHCVNPAHLEPVTPRENTLRGEGITAKLATATHCPRGHALVEGNLVLAALQRGQRNCRTCGLARCRTPEYRSYTSTPEYLAKRRAWRRARKHKNVAHAGN